MGAPVVPTCAWFALCANDADGVVDHPILGQVPTCTRCATKAEQTLLQVVSWVPVSA